MSGVEVAGIILSLWPVITTLAAAYKDARTGENLQKLAKEVEVSEVIYKNCLRSLLLCDDYLPEEEILKLLGSVDGADMAWKQPSVQQKLRDALSDKTCDSIDFALTEIHAAMGILEKSLRKGEVDVASFRGRVRISIMQTKARNPHSNFQQALIRLTKNVSLLRDLISMPKLLPSSQRAREEKGGRRPVSEARRKSVPPQHTNNFFKAIKEGLQKCTCEDGHDTSLRVNCEDYFHIVLGIHDPDGDLTELSLRARSTFDTGITTLDGEVSPEDDENPTDEIQSPLPTVLTEKESRTTLTGVTSCWSPRSRNDSMSSTLQSQHAVQMSFSTDNPKAAGSTPRDALDLCVLLRNLSSTQPTSTRPSEPLRSFGTLRRGDTIYTARGEPKVLPAVSIECLDDRLKNLCDCRLRKRVEIAQSLAFAVVQFWSTEWIDASWTWRSFSVREDTRGIQLFVTKRILPDRAEKNPAEEPAKFWKLIREPVLVRLGFALIELALAKRLSELRAEAGEDESEAGLSEDEKDYHTARRVLDTKQLEEDCSSTYQAVVEACLTCDVAKDSSYLSLTSRAPSFQDDVDTHVVQPLRHYFERTWVTAQA